MQIRPITPSFNGYIEVHANPYLPHEAQSGNTTFNTNSITITQAPYSKADYYSTYIANSGEAYLSTCPYSVLQKACLLADRHKDAIVSIDSNNHISIKELKLDKLG